MAGVLLVMGIGVPLLIVLWVAGSGRSWVALTLDSQFLTMVIAGGVAAVAARLIAMVEVWWAWGHPIAPNWRNLVALALVVAVCAPAMFGLVQVGWARSALSTTFGNPLTEPLFTPDPAPLSLAGPDTTSPATARTAPIGDPPTTDPLAVTAHTEPTLAPATTVVTEPLRPTSGVNPGLHPNVSTILLLGGDAGPGRWSLRTDSMMLFSVDRASGRASLISIPRNLMNMLSPPGTALAKAYPTGFTDLANAIYPIVQSRAALRKAYDTLPGVDPGVVALAQAIGYSLDVQIDDYVLVDMRGFVNLVDAVGGVTVDVPKAVPMPGNIPGATTQYPDTIGPGRIHMNGTTALGYARSRHADSDYQRTERQRALLAALAQQVSLGDVLGSYRAVAEALGDTLHTSLTPEELTNTLNVIGGETAIVESVGLVPPLVDVNHPDWNLMAKVVAEVQVALATGQPSGWSK